MFNLFIKEIMIFLAMMKKILLKNFKIGIFLVLPIFLSIFFILHSLASGRFEECVHIVSNTQELETANSRVRAGETVCIRQGDYSAGIAPQNSGISGNLIVYRAFDENNKPTIFRPVDLRNKSYVTISDVNITATADGKYYARLSGSDHITIENSRMTGNPPDSPKHPPVDLTNATYAVLRNNYIFGNNQDYNDLVMIAGNAHHNLLERNTLDQGSHTNLFIEGPSYGNIIRNNEFINDYHHCINVVFGSKSNIFENNNFKRCGSGSQSGPGIDRAGSDGDIHFWASENLFRFNILQQAGRNAPDFMPALNAFSVSVDSNLAIVENNRLYNNIIYNNFGYGVRVGVGNNRLEGSSKDNIFVNNIVYNNGTRDLQVFYSHWGTPSPRIVTGEEWRNNIIGDSGKLSIGWNGGRYTPEQLQTDKPPIPVQNVAFKGNFSGDPGFTDPANDNFRFKSDSVAIDAGDFLTRTVSSGSGKRVIVNDARFFTDGLGIVSGDKIQIGDDGKEEDLIVASVNYANNTIILNREISWDKGEGVSFPYSGNNPDIGVYEFALEESQNFCYLKAADSDLECEVKAGINHIIAVVKEWGKPDSYADYDGSGIVDINDLIMVVKNWK